MAKALKGRLNSLAKRLGKPEGGPVTIILPPEIRVNDTGGLELPPGVTGPAIPRNRPVKLVCTHDGSNPIDWV